MDLFHKSELFESSNDLQLANEDSFGIFFRDLIIRCSIITIDPH